MTSVLGYYVHHHGDGHLQRARLIAEHLPDQVVLLGTNLRGRTGAVACIDLPDDRLDVGASFDGVDGSEERPASLHYAPLDHEGVRRRAAMISGFIAEVRPALMVVDVSVEVAMLTRLTSTPTVYVRLCGDRSDAPHLDAFRGARRLLAPFHPALDEPSLPDWVREKTHYAPGLARGEPRSDVVAGSVLVVQSGGGAVATDDEILLAAGATPDWTWTVIGGQSRDSPLANLTFLGWIDDPELRLARAEVIIGAAGDGVVNGVLAASRPFICFPQARPFREQVSKAARLKALDCALVLEAWPGAAVWPHLLEEAIRQPLDARRALHDEMGAKKVAAWLARAAEEGAIRRAQPGEERPSSSGSRSSEGFNHLEAASPA